MTPEQLPTEVVVPTRRSSFVAQAVPCAIVLAVAYWLGTLYVPEGSARTMLETQRGKHIDMLVIGDSVTETNVDEALLGSRTGLDMFDGTLGGSQSAIWYLTMKQLLEEHPEIKIVLIGFRDNQLTDTTNKIYATTKRNVIELEGWRDEDVFEKFYVRNFGAQYSFFIRTVPLLRIAEHVQEKIYPLSKQAALRLLDPRSNGNYIAKILSVSENPGAETAISPQEAFDFKKQSARSLLGPIVNLAKESGVKLVFLRHKTNQNKTESGYRQKYAQQLREFTETEGVKFLDYTTLEGFTSKDFKDSTHLAPEGARKYSEYLLRDLYE